MTNTKIWSSLALLVGLFLLMAFKSTENPIERGLIAYYSFNNCDATDETEGGSDGKLHGKIGCHCGVEGNGLTLNGDTDFIEFEGRVNQYFNTTDFTLSFYFRPTAKSIFKQSMISKRDNCEEINMLDIQLNQQLGEVDTDFYESDTRYYRYLSPEIEGTGWYHFALVRNGIFAYTYINGQLRQESKRCSGVDIANEALLAFGNSPCVWTGGSRRFQGVLDELRVYDRALEHFEIKKLYRKYPVESAEVNCVSFNENKNPASPLDNRKSDYLCANY